MVLAVKAVVELIVDESMIDNSTVSPGTFFSLKIVSVCVSRKIPALKRQHRHYSAFYHHWSLPSVPSGFTGARAGNRHNRGINTVVLLLYIMCMRTFV